MPDALMLSNISKSFIDKTVLDELNLAVPYGSVFAFLGNNGEGKSTTIRILTGLASPDNGEVVICGEPLFSRHRRLLRRTHGVSVNCAALSLIGGLIDAPSLYPNLTAAEFLSIGCRIKGLSRSEIARVLSVVSLQSSADRVVATFSLGMKQRLAIAHALLGNPKLLILDEPTNGLDPSGIRDIRKLLAELPATTGTTVFFSTHNLDEVEKMATRFAVLKAGSIQFESDITQWKASQQQCQVIEVAKPQQALACLTGQGFNARLLDNGLVEIDTITREQQAAIHRLLIKHDVEIYQSYHKKQSLEQWFTDEHTH
ncbi:ABC transporter ATP-binding protein [Alteromonas lipolytica]|uniref:ABC transporter domain-containing protein n=1 Tax=Alteromonas lipolytica TaxID=1856405 RepID=A0A1E8FKD0_9ALTE|nr:ATP-binding cassette domain-containing protein [Alteromonas lipolytica]OFI36390.1 hypothetical protein BFC17_00475 [Alteromonas lipolytica]GGF70308.1 bacitracin ABC transporter ATP-binding protein [Alteromonas lipolytica]